MGQSNCAHPDQNNLSVLTLFFWSSEGRSRDGEGLDIETMLISLIMTAYITCDRMTHFTFWRSEVGD